MYPTALPVGSSFSSPQDPRGQSRRGFCDLFFTIAEGSVVQKWSRPSSSPNLVKQNVLHTHVHTHPYTHTHTHTHTSSSFSNTPIETHTHTHTMLKGAERTIRNPLLRAGDKHLMGARGQPLSSHPDDTAKLEEGSPCPTADSGSEWHPTSVVLLC